MAPKLIANGEDIDRIACREGEQVQALSGWRRKVFGEDAMALCSGRLALGVDGKRIRLIPAR